MLCECRAYFFTQLTLLRPSVQIVAANHPSSALTGCPQLGRRCAPRRLPTRAHRTQCAVCRVPYIGPHTLGNPTRSAVPLNSMWCWVCIGSTHFKHPSTHTQQVEHCYSELCSLLKASVSPATCFTLLHTAYMLDAVDLFRAALHCCLTNFGAALAQDSNGLVSLRLPVLKALLQHDGLQVCELYMYTQSAWVVYTNVWLYACWVARDVYHCITNNDHMMNSQPIHNPFVLHRWKMRCRCLR